MTGRYYYAAKLLHELIRVCGDDPACVQLLLNVPSEPFPHESIFNSNLVSVLEALKGLAGNGSRGKALHLHESAPCQEGSGKCQHVTCVRRNGQQELVVGIDRQCPPSPHGLRRLSCCFIRIRLHANANSHALSHIIILTLISRKNESVPRHIMLQDTAAGSTVGYVGEEDDTALPRNDQELVQQLSDTACDLTELLSPCYKIKTSAKNSEQ